MCVRRCVRAYVSLISSAQSANGETQTTKRTNRKCFVNYVCHLIYKLLLLLLLMRVNLQGKCICIYMYVCLCICGTQSCQIKLGMCGGLNSLLIILKALRASQYDIVGTLIGALAAQLFIRNFCKSRRIYTYTFCRSVECTYDS